MNQPPRSVAPEACNQLASWMRSSAGKVTVSDQIDSASGRVIGGSYYPRLVTVISLLQPATDKHPAPEKQ